MPMSAPPPGAKGIVTIPPGGKARQPHRGVGAPVLRLRPNPCRCRLGAGCRWGRWSLAPLPGAVSRRRLLVAFGGLPGAFASACVGGVLPDRARGCGSWVRVPIGCSRGRTIAALPALGFGSTSVHRSLDCASIRLLPFERCRERSDPWWTRPRRPRSLPGRGLSLLAADSRSLRTGYGKGRGTAARAPIGSRCRCYPHPVRSGQRHAT
jgi:hypothetical protein